MNAIAQELRDIADKAEAGEKLHWAKAMRAGAMQIEKWQPEITASRTQLADLNAQAERFERGWYLRGDALEKLKQWAEAYPVEAFPEMTKEDWKRADEVLSAAGLSLTRISASNMRHVITQTVKIVDDGLAV